MAYTLSNYQHSRVGVSGEASFENTIVYLNVEISHIFLISIEFCIIILNLYKYLE